MSSKLELDVSYRVRVKATEVTAGLAESNGSLPPGLRCDSLHVTCGQTAVHRDQLRVQHSVTSIGKFYLYFDMHSTVAFITHTQLATRPFLRHEQLLKEWRKRWHYGAKGRRENAP